MNYDEIIEKYKDTPLSKLRTLTASFGHPVFPSWLFEAICSNNKCKTFLDWGRTVAGFKDEDVSLISSQTSKVGAGRAIIAFLHKRNPPKEPPVGLQELFSITVKGQITRRHLVPYDVTAPASGSFQIHARDAARQIRDLGYNSSLSEQRMKNILKNLYRGIMNADTSGLDGEDRDHWLCGSHVVSQPEEIEITTEQIESIRHYISNP